MATVIRVGSKASPPRKVSNEPEDDQVTHRRGNAGTDAKEEPKRKKSTTITLGSKARTSNQSKEERSGSVERKAVQDEEEEKKDEEKEMKPKSSGTTITLGSKAQSPKPAESDEEPREQKRKSSVTKITLGSSAKSPLTNGDIKGNDPSYEESYNKAKELYGEPPPINTKALPKMMGVKDKLESWPPKEAQDNEFFTVEGYGTTNPYIEKPPEKKDEEPKYAQQTPHRDTTHYDTSRQRKKPEEPNYVNQPLPKNERVEIDDDHVKPVSQLKRRWTYKPQPKVPGVNRPSTQVKDEDSWIKHIKAPVEYDKPPEEPAWKQLVRNRRWKSTIRARFPSKQEEVIEFERRSTTPKNWSRLLKDKKSVRVIGAITGIGPEGEELLWRLASRRDKIEDSDVEENRYQPREPSEALAYEHVKDNLEAAVYACLEGGERQYYDDDASDVASIADTIPSIQSNRGSRLSRSSSNASDSGSPKLRRRPPRLAPEDFKKQIALEKSRDATLRWQFSSDPYDSVHENQLLPFEMAVLYGEKDRRLRNLLRKLVKPEDMPDSAFSSPPGTPRRRPPYYDSEPELEGDYYGGQQFVNTGGSRQSRPKKRVPPPPPPRRGRSASPSLHNRGLYEDDVRFTPQDLVLSDDLRDEIQKLDQLSMQLKEEHDRNPAVKDTKARIESGSMEESGASYKKDVPEEVIRTALEDRKKSFLKEADKDAAEDELRAQRTADINQREIRARRDRFIEQERQSMDESESPERPQKPRKKVQRIKSDAELHEVFRKRREASDVNVVGDEQSGEASGEMKELVSNIQETFGEEGQRTPPTRRQSSIDIGELKQEEAEYDADDDNECLSNYADERIKVKPKGRQAATKNPVRHLQDRDDLRTDTDEELVAKGHEIKESALIGRNKIVATGKAQKREHELTDDAKKGLESKEDIRGASQALKATSKDRSGVSTERINEFDGIKPVMLFHIKGSRHIQTRLVEPTLESLNAGDVFVMVTKKYLHQWNGKNCSIMEKARGTEVTSVIHQWKEMCCEATFINVMDQDREKGGNATTAFWKALGGKGTIRDENSVLSDADFEKGILKAAKIYEIDCDSADELHLLEEYHGKLPSKKWLDTEKAYVLDFGAEVYAWIGRQCQGLARKRAVELGQQMFDNGYSTEAEVNPLFPNELNPCSGKVIARPEWATFARMTEKAESVLFRRKFFDWPDPVDLKVKTVESKVHAQLTKDYDELNAQALSPVSAKEMIEPPPEPNLIVDGCLIGRGKGGKDPETLFKYAVETLSLRIWRISGKTSEEIEEDQFGMFYSAEAYVLRWCFQIMRTGIRSLKGGKSKKDDTGKDKVIYFFWQGRDCSTSDKGTAALMTMEIDTEEGPQILVTQGREPPAFFQLFDGQMIVHLGKFGESVDYDKPHMYWIRNEEISEACMVEIKLTSKALRSRGTFVIADPSQGVIYLWHGAKSTKKLNSIGIECAKMLREKIDQMYSNRMKIIELEEGDEDDGFWTALGDDEDYVSYLEVKKRFEFTPRCYIFSSIHGEFTATELTSSTYLPSEICAFPVLQSDLYNSSQPALIFIDARYKLFLWLGWWPLNSTENEESGPNTDAERHRFDVNRLLAMQSIKGYAEEVNLPLSRAFIVYAGCEPLEFKNLFPYWEDREDVSDIMRKAGKNRGDKVKIEDELQRLSNLSLE